MRWLLAAAIALGVLSAPGCKGPKFVVAELDALESRLDLAPAQKPAWEDFRREAEAAGSRDAAWRTELRAAGAGERFDAGRAQRAADSARADASRMIDAWARLDAVLTPAQRSSIRKELAPE